MATELYFHLTWTTRERADTIEAPAAKFLESFLRTRTKRHGARAVSLGILNAHVHMVVEMPAVFDIAALVKDLKKASIQTWAERHEHEGPDLQWAVGYAAQSISPSKLGQVVRYIQRQVKHHPDLAIRPHPAVGEDRGI